MGEVFQLEPQESKTAESRRISLEAREVLAFLNQRTGRQYREVDVNIDPIKQRIKSGITANDLRAIIAKKIREWGIESLHLRPATLFNKTKCEQYYGELRR